MAEHEHDDEGELVWEKRGGWWLGNDQVDGRIGLALVRAMLVSQSQDSKVGEFERYHINSCGRVLVDRS